ncbi:MAG: hypothetical protein R3E32_00115 [Chitinophagales bacterium]
MNNNIAIKHLVKKLFYTVCIVFISLATPLLHAQVQIEIYNKAIEDINCSTIKLLLIGYDRPLAARNIKDCNYDSIEKEVNKVKENQVRGYKTMFLKLSAEINAYKGKVENPSEYSHFANALEEVSTYAVQQFRATCQKHQQISNRVCVRLDQKVLQLEGEINDIANNALTEISKHTFGVSKPIKVTTPKTTNTASETSTEAVTTANNDEVTPTKPSSGGGTSLIVVFILIVLVGAVGWLFKENYLIKEELADLKLLLKALNQRN